VAATTLLRSNTASGAAFVDLGSGEPVVLLHGVGLRLEQWAAQIEELAATHRAIAVDLPGHGFSKPIEGDATLRSFVEWLLEVLDDLHLSQVNLGGHSMGALIAGCCTVTHPQRVMRVALISPVHRRDAVAAAAVRARASAIATGQINPDAPLARWFPDEESVSIPHRLTRQWLEAVDPDAYATAYRAFADGDDAFADRWSEVRCPALFLTGELDPNSTPAMSQMMAEAAPFGEARIIPGQRHMVNLTAPQEVTASLKQWLARKVQTQ
jgi:(E)-2-((N-methylformamido)methylene)succinate hydrolase